MRILLQIISAAALVATLAPAIMFLNGSLDLAVTKSAMLAATLVWFIVTPFWMGRMTGPANEEIVL